jgi:hypothetical protein
VFEIDGEFPEPSPAVLVLAGMTVLFLRRHTGLA